MTVLIVGSLLILLLSAVGLFCFVVIQLIPRRHEQRQLLILQGRCAECGYNLRYGHTGTCPECGAVISLH